MNKNYMYVMIKIFSVCVYKVLGMDHTTFPSLMIAFQHHFDTSYCLQILPELILFKFIYINFILMREKLNIWKFERMCKKM